MSEKAVRKKPKYREEAKYTVVPGTHVSAIGRSRYRIQCECGERHTVFSWSFTASGKVCRTCNKIIHMSGLVAAT